MIALPAQHDPDDATMRRREPPRPHFPYPVLKKVGVVGDRRSAALVAADGTLGWLCWPDFDSPPLFASLLDNARGGYWYVGPHRPSFGQQTYVGNTAILVTSWNDAGHSLELTDFMPLPQTDRPSELEGSRSVVRRLRCKGGEGWCRMEMEPRDDFGARPAVHLGNNRAVFETGTRRLSLWSSLAPDAFHSERAARFLLREGEEAWFVLSCGDEPLTETAEGAEALLEETQHYWSGWAGNLNYLGPRAEWVRRSAATIHLLSYAPTGALVAAPTASLPDRVGGELNYDYRYAWVRDVSLALANIALLGDLETASRYMDWLSGLGSDNPLPLQVLYRIKGGRQVPEQERTDLEGYRRSRPVRFGNHAAQQYQLDGLGYLADCALVYLEQGGDWHPEYWTMVRRVADHAAASWHQPSNGIWELSPPQHFVSDKVMAWVTLERASMIAAKTRAGIDTGPWREAAEAIREDVLQKGWSDRLGAFRQRYESDTLDASVLLMALMGFLPARDARMRATMSAIDRELCRGDLVYRFDPQAQAEPLGEPLGEAEAAFLPCTFWLAAAYAMAGETDRADALLGKAESLAADLMLFSEEADPKTGALLGNMPLLLSHAAHLRATTELARARSLHAAELLAGRAALKVRQLLGANSAPPDERKSEDAPQ